MFTGIVEETGEVLSVESDADGRRLRIGTAFDGLAEGQSISVSGACLTVEEYVDGEWFSVFLARETLDRTYLGKVDVGDAVNLERAVPADGRMDGHFVQGHVDATAAIRNVEREGSGDKSADGRPESASAEESSDEGYSGDWTYTFTIPDGLAGYVVEKGSIAVDGISLTVANCSEDEFSVAIVPETYRLTTLSEKSVGDPVHLELDVVAKYVESLVDAEAVENLTGRR